MDFHELEVKKCLHWRIHAVNGMPVKEKCLLGYRNFGNLFHSQSSLEGSYMYLWLTASACHSL